MSSVLTLVQTAQIEVFMIGRVISVYSVVQVYAIAIVSLLKQGYKHLVVYLSSIWQGQNSFPAYGQMSNLCTPALVCDIRYGKYLSNLMGTADNLDT